MKINKKVINFNLNRNDRLENKKNFVIKTNFMKLAIIICHEHSKHENNVKKKKA